MFNHESYQDMAIHNLSKYSSSYKINVFIVVCIHTRISNGYTTILLKSSHDLYHTLTSSSLLLLTQAVHSNTELASPTRVVQVSCKIYTYIHFFIIFFKFLMNFFQLCNKSWKTFFSDSPYLVWKGKSESAYNLELSSGYELGWSRDEIL